MPYNCLGDLYKSEIVALWNELRNKKIIDVDDSKFQMNENNIKDDGFTIISNGIITKDSDTIKNLTIGDLLASNIVLIFIPLASSILSLISS